MDQYRFRKSPAIEKVLLSWGMNQKTKIYDRDRDRPVWTVKKYRIEIKFKSGSRDWRILLETLWYFLHFQIFPGNFDRNTIVTKHLCSGIVARHLRIIAHDRHDHCCMRIEIFGIPLARGKLYSMFISAGFAWLTLRTTIRKETIPFHPTLISLWV